MTFSVARSRLLLLLLVQDKYSLRLGLAILLDTFRD